MTAKEARQKIIQMIKDGNDDAGFEYKYCPSDEAIDAIIQSVATDADKHGYQRGVRDCSKPIIEFHGDQNLSKEG